MADSDIVVSGLATAAGISYNALTYATDDPHEDGLLNQSLDVVEVWASQTNNRTGATKVAEGNKTNALHVALGNGETWYYWIKARNKQGYYGEWYPLSATGGIEGTTAEIAASESGVSDAEWTDFSSFTVTAGTGSFTSITNKRGIYKEVGSLVIFNFEFRIATNGTGGSHIIVGLPIPGTPPQAPQGMVSTNGGVLASGFCGFVATGVPETTLIIQGYDGSYLGQNGATIRGTLAYAGAP